MEWESFQHRELRRNSLLDSRNKSSSRRSEFVHQFVAMADAKNKYDRQLRIWGEQGQSALEKANICLLKCGPTGSEALKNLILGGVGSITVIDGSKVEVGDLGNNFMLDDKCIGETKAKSVCAFLQELNDAVTVKFVEELPEALIETNPSFFSQFTLVVATQLAESSVVKLDKICRQQNVMLIVARSYGLSGLIRVSCKEHVVIESKPDHFVDDLRLHNPWPELHQYHITFLSLMSSVYPCTTILSLHLNLFRFAESIDVNIPDPVIHKNIPYVIILLKAAAEWKDTHGSMLPSSRDEKKQFKEQLKGRMINMDEDNYKEAIDSAYKVSSPFGISKGLQKILDDASTKIHSSSSDFWVLVAALKEFIEKEGNGEPPLEGSIPDMTSSTECYVSLQKIYLEKAEADCLAIESQVKSILKKINRDPCSISKTTIKTFCRNSRKLAVCRYRSIEDELISPVLPEVQKYLTDEDYSTAFTFYVLLRAVDRFAANYNRFPGIFYDEMDEEIARLKTVAVSILNDLGTNGSFALMEDLIHEMCRFGAAELHTVASIIGGIASQEAIKLITKQFIPMSGTLIFNGIDHKSQVLNL